MKKEVAPPKYPSNHGSHSVMIDQEETDKLEIKDYSEELQRCNDLFFGVSPCPKELSKKDISEARQSVLKNIAEQPVILKDDYGNYQTQRKYLDSGLADPNRNDFRRVEKFRAEKT